MAVWITHGSRAVGIDNGLIRAHDFAHLVDAAALLEAAAAEHDRILAEARMEADAVLESARVEAASLVAEAQSSFEQAYKSGLDRGLHDAATQWAGQALDAAGATRRNLYRQSERLSNLVSMAVERVIDQEDRAALFRRSLRTIVKLVKSVPVLTMRVNEQDREHARRAVDTVLKQSRSTMSIEVLSDPALPPGGCRFESDDGVVDASLDTQLEALRRAVRRAARQIAPALSHGDEATDGEDAVTLDEAH
jgi:type III secretion protein L